MIQGDALEPWLRGTLTEVPAVPRAVLHALQLAEEDVERWCGSLSDEDLNARPAGLASVAFHIRHIARSLDRLLSYAEGSSLSASQFAALRTEQQAAGKAELFAEFTSSLAAARERVRKLQLGELAEGRLVGKKQLPATLGGLLVHIADHTQRHVGQAITTSKVLMNTRHQRPSQG
jgi:uncharacterized damage-inducible protein DinB